MQNFEQHIEATRNLNHEDTLIGLDYAMRSIDTHFDKFDRTRNMSDVLKFVVVIAGSVIRLLVTVRRLESRVKELEGRLNRG